VWEETWSLELKGSASNNFLNSGDLKNQFDADPFSGSKAALRLACDIARSLSLALHFVMMRSADFIFRATAS
jgi:hypothetical protein